MHGGFECAPSALPSAAIKVAVWLLSRALSGALSAALFAPLFGRHQGAVRALPGRCQDLRATYSKVESDFFLLDSTFVFAVKIAVSCCKKLKI